MQGCSSCKINFFLNNPSSHAEWRKLAKKARRKRIRRSIAQAREAKEAEERAIQENAPQYKQWLAEQQALEAFKEQEEARLAAERHKQWLKIEEEAQKQWIELQQKLKQARAERAKQNALIRLEWEKEQARLEEIKRRKEEELKQKQENEQRLSREIEDFIEQGGHTPEHLEVSLETQPGKMVCPFFQKTGACRFRDSCSRNHIRPGVSRTILIPNFYSHYSLEQSENEHGSDATLEFESDELYSHFEEFFNDVVSEMEKCGRIRQFRVCANHEAHLRGNVYVEYGSKREAMKSYRVFNGRWYAGKQLSVEFCRIESWKSAICGLNYKRKCPKGTNCNFLHVFHNPNNLYQCNDLQKDRTRNEKLCDGRNWRWSESPDRNFGCSNDWDQATEDEEVRVRRNGHRSSRRSDRSKRSRSRSKRSKSQSRRSRSRSKRSKSRSKRSKSRSKRSRSRSKSNQELSHQHKSRHDKSTKTGSLSKSRRRSRSMSR